MSTLLIIDSNPVLRRARNAGLRRGAEARGLQLGADRRRRTRPSDATTWCVPMAHACETGAMRARMTARRPSCSRRPCRCTAASARTGCWRCSPTPAPTSTLDVGAGDLEERLAPISRRPGTTRWPPASCRTPPVRKPTCRCARTPDASDAAGASRASARHAVPPGPASVGRTLRQQCLAAGAAAAADQADLGQSAADLAGAGASN